MGLAESYDPSFAAWEVATADHLLVLGKAEMAREKAREILALSKGTPCYEHAGFSLIGLAELALGNTKAAMEAFTASADPDLVSSLYASSRDLRLAIELLNAGATGEPFRDYLREARLRAKDDGDTALEEYIRQAEDRFFSPLDSSDLK